MSGNSIEFGEEMKYFCQKCLSGALQIPINIDQTYRWRDVNLPADLKDLEAHC